MNEIVRVGFWTSISTLAKILSYLFIVKVIAYYTGPEGLGKMGQFMSLMTIVGVSAGGGISNGIIKYIAEYEKTKPDEIKKIINSGFFITLCSSLIFFIVGFIFCQKISFLLFDTEDFSSIVLVLSITQLAIAVNNFLFAIINGFKDFKTLVYANSIGAITSVVISYVLIKYFYLYGMLLALIFSQGCLVFITITLIRNKNWFNTCFFTPKFDKKTAKNLLHYSFMAITTAIITPLSQILIRDHIAKELSWSDVGYWEAVTKISDVYLLFATTVMTIYYLPKLSGITDKNLIKKEIVFTYKIVIPFLFLMSTSVFFLRDIIIYILYGEAFFSVRNLFYPQLLGDIIKISAWVISFLMLAKKKTRLFFLTEIIFSCSYVILAIVLINHFSLIGAIYAFPINCFIYLIFMIIMLYKGKLYD